MNKMQADNKLCRQTFLDAKTNHRKHNVYGPRRHNIVVFDPLNSM